MADHAGKIDVARAQLAGSQAFNEMRQAVEGHEGSISTLGRAMAGTQAAVEQNDEKMKKLISDNDERFKADVVERDAKVKEQFGITLQHCEQLVNDLRAQTLQLIAAGAGPGGMPAPAPQPPPGIGQATMQIQVQMDNLAASAQNVVAGIQGAGAPEGATPWDEGGGGQGSQGIFGGSLRAPLRAPLRGSLRAIPLPLRLYSLTFFGLCVRS